MFQRILSSRESSNLILSNVKMYEKFRCGKKKILQFFFLLSLKENYPISVDHTQIEIVETEIYTLIKDK